MELFEKIGLAKPYSIHWLDFVFSGGVRGKFQGISIDSDKISKDIINESLCSLPNYPKDFLEHQVWMLYILLQVKSNPDSVEFINDIPAYFYGPPYGEAFLRYLSSYITGNLVEPQHKKVVKFPLVYDPNANQQTQDGFGTVAGFELSAVPDSTDQHGIIIHPDNMFTLFDDDFLDVFKVASNKIKDWKSGSVCVKIVNQSQSSAMYRFPILRGNSGGGALMLALKALDEDAVVGRNIAVSFSIKKDDHLCYTVNSLADKLKTLSNFKDNKYPIDLVICKDDNFELNDISKDWSIRLVPCGTINEAFGTATGDTRSLLNYLKLLKRKLGTIPVYFATAKNEHIKFIDQNCALKEYSYRGYGERRNDDSRRIKISEIIRESTYSTSNITVVLADAGFGKTTILKKLATEIAVDSIGKVEECADPGVVIPVFITFTDLVRGFHREDKNGINAILKESLENKFDKKVDRNEIVLFIDSFDDLTPDEVNILSVDLKFTDWLNRQTFPVYISSRPPINLSGLESYNLITPLGFDKDSIREFIDNWGIIDKAQRDILVESPLSKIPILLFLMCKSGTLSENATKSQVQLYKSIVISMVRESWNTNQVAQGLRADSKLLEELGLLGILSWHLHIAGRSEFDIDWLRNRFGDNHDQFASLGDGSPLFISESSEGGYTKIQFIHKSFLEFLAAYFLSSRINSEDWAAKVEYAKGNEVDIRTLIDKKAWLPEWEAVIIFMAGLLEDTNNKELLNIIRAQDDIFKHRLSLAARCLPEVLSDLAD